MSTRKISGVENPAKWVGIDRANIAKIKGLTFLKIPYFLVENRFKGLTPSFSDWDTAPTNPGNATDDDWSTSTGTGQTGIKAPAGGFTGYMDFDMGARHPIIIQLKVGLWGSVSGPNHEVDVSFSNDPPVEGWFSASYYNMCFADGTEEEIVFGWVQFVRARYIRFRFWYAGKGTGYAKIYEVQALEFPQVAGGG